MKIAGVESQGVIRLEHSLHLVLKSISVIRSEAVRCERVKFASCLLLGFQGNVLDFITTYITHCLAVLLDGTPFVTDILDI